MSREITWGTKKQKKNASRTYRRWRALRKHTRSKPFSHEGYLVYVALRDPDLPPHSHTAASRRADPSGGPSLGAGTAWTRVTHRYYTQGHAAVFFTSKSMVRTSNAIPDNIQVPGISCMIHLSAFQRRHHNLHVCTPKGASTQLPPY